MSKKSAAAKSRARMYILRDLSWLEGYPLGATAWAFARLGDDAASVELSRSLLSRSTRTLNMLVREFPRVLPGLVGDVDLWAQTHRALLDLLKPVVHGGQSLPDRPLDVHPRIQSRTLKVVRRFEAEHPALSSVSRAVQYAYWTRPDRWGWVFSWLERNADVVLSLKRALPDEAVAICLRLLQLEEELGARRVAPLLECLGQPDVWAVPLELPDALRAQVTQMLGGSSEMEPIEVPAPTLGPRLSTWCLWLAAQDKSVRRRGVDAFAMLRGPSLTEAWRGWWDDLVRDVAAVATLPKARGKKDPNLKKRRAARARVRRRLNAPPPVLCTDCLVYLLRSLPEQPNTRLFELIRAELKGWPDVLFGAHTPLALAFHWSEMWPTRADAETRPVVSAIKGLTRYAADVDHDAARLKPWAHLWRSRQTGESPGYGVDDAFEEWLATPQKARSFWRAIRTIARPTQASTELLVYTCAAVPEHGVEFAYRALRDGPKALRYVEPSQIRLAFAFMPVSPAQFRALVALFDRAYGQHEGLDGSFSQMASLFRDAGVHASYLAELDRVGVESFLHVAMKVRFLQGQKRRLPALVFVEAPRSQGWLSRYPESLWSSLQHLGRCDPGAEHTARRLLKKDLPDQRQIARELSALRAVRPQSANIERRIANLEARLEEAPTLSEARAKRLAERIQRAGDAKLFARWQDAVDARVAEALAHWAGLEDSADWLSDARLVRAMLPVPSLPPHVQALARRILVARAGEGPWDLRAAGPNRRFLGKMKNAGVELDPWLDGFRQSVETKGGLRLTLALEDDPLELFLMGHHFDTCLSPGAFNYFSVFSNVADINKRVLYARDDQGRVFGRVLLGLTDEGGLLAFHPYAHARAAEFSAIVRRFVQALAKAMGTLVVPEGRMSTLVSKDWYDDGPHDFTQQHPNLEDGSPFRSALPSVAPQDFLGLVRGAVAPLPLNELTLPLIAGLPEVEARAELMWALLPLARRAQLPLPLHTVCSIVRTLASSELVIDRASLARWVYTRALRETPLGRLPWDAAWILIDLAPSHAVRLLTKTRAAHVRRWADEYDGYRLMLVGRAYEELQRWNKAAELYAWAVESSMPEKGKAACRSALEEIRGSAKEEGRS